MKSVTFGLGQKVIYRAPYRHTKLDEWGNTLPVDGQIYTIRAFINEDPRVSLSTGILLEEIRNTPRPCAPDGELVAERGWNLQFFEPLYQ